ncbi:hypothetical protein GCM10010912_15280 [Paenibacillus albidus]|uniref:ABC transporter domain-containing protein n=1 Tax=Paenibacillus albidus TaxID=2041023 RepID=A0A917C3Y4_9BACL|nr:ABC transporter ATP-binding protein [Paenibacillus albidus]GGF71064.1 hypothetical protein GCM10010912_15280 [Paenibacillus albidus]
MPDSRIDEVLAIVRLTESAKEKVGGYSLGMKQRLGLASALLRKPQLLILDEPTNGLDPAGIQEIRQLMLTLTREQGLTIMLSSHLLSEVDTIADEIGIINGGKLVFQGGLVTLQNKSRKVLHLALDRPEEAARTLAEQGIGVECRGRTISVSLEGETPLMQAQIFKALSGFNILEVKETAKSLEDIFLELTGKGASL